VDLFCRLAITTKSREQSKKMREWHGPTLRESDQTSSCFCERGGKEQQIQSSFVCQQQVAKFSSLWFQVSIAVPQESTPTPSLVRSGWVWSGLL